MVFVWTPMGNLIHTASGESIFALRRQIMWSLSQHAKSENKQKKRETNVNKIASKITLTPAWTDAACVIPPKSFFQIKVETWKANWCNQLLIYFTLLFCKQSNPSRHTRRLNCDWLVTDEDHCAVANIFQPAHLVTLHTVSLLTQS